MKTKRFAKLVALLLAIALLPICAFAASNSTTHYYVVTANKKSLNMRAGTSTNDPIIATIPYGAEVGWIGECDNPAWAAVYYGNTNGYVMRRYLSTKQPDSDPGTEIELPKFSSFKAADYYAVVTPSTPTGFVNMRWAPTTDMAVHARYHQGDTLRVIAETKTWAQVLDEETMTCGFMLKRFLH